MFFRVQTAGKEAGMPYIAGLPRGSLKYLSDRGILERVACGVYTLPEVWEDELVNIQCRYKRGINSLDTALFLCDLTDRTSARFHMFFPPAIVMKKSIQIGKKLHRTLAEPMQE